MSGGGDSAFKVVLLLGAGLAAGWLLRGIYDGTLSSTKEQTVLSQSQVDANVEAIGKVNKSRDVAAAANARAQERLSQPRPGQDEDGCPPGSGSVSDEYQQLLIDHANHRRAQQRERLRQGAGGLQ